MSTGFIEHDGLFIPYGRINDPDAAHIDFFSAEQIARGQSLYKIPRYHTIDVMTHRTNLFSHSLRVTGHSLLFSNILTGRGVYVDEPKLFYMADRHDDTELITGDIPTPVKRSATSEQKQKMKAEERLAAEKVSPLIEGPRSVPEFYPGLFDEYEGKESLEARIVNFADKWDGYEEAEHEIVCGDNRARFEQVILDYQKFFKDLYEQNEDWLPHIRTVLGDEFTELIPPQTLTAKKPEELDYTDLGSFLRSLNSGKLSSYGWWLRFNKSHFSPTADFLHMVFPGWIDRLPKEIIKDIERVKCGYPRRESSPLWLPDGYSKKSKMTFGEELQLDLFPSWLMAMAEMSLEA